VSTRVFPRLERDRMALKLNGKDDRLHRADFRTLASTAGLRAVDADAAIDDMIKRMQQAVDMIALPKLPNYGPEGEAMAAKMLDICRTRIESFA
ncbi:MAG: type II toxin-antitoxin system HipA family toxin, partial [bacterium]